MDRGQNETYLFSAMGNRFLALLNGSEVRYTFMEETFERFERVFQLRISNGNLERRDR